MNGKIIYIGGASAAGKSTIAAEISVSTGLPIIELDRIHDILEHKIRERQVLLETTACLVRLTIANLLDTGSMCIIEGGWISPKNALEIKEQSNGRFLPMFCGFPNADLDERLDQIFRDGKHWLHHKPLHEARQFLASQFDMSETLQADCSKLNVPYFDFSDFRIGPRQLIQYVEQRIPIGAESR